MKGFTEDRITHYHRIVTSNTPNLTLSRTEWQLPTNSTVQSSSLENAIFVCHTHLNVAHATGVRKDENDKIEHLSYSPFISFSKI
jgi:hypothetical protein